MASTRTTTPDRPAADADPSAEAAPQLLTFVVAGRRWGCRLEAVREIFVARPTTRLPGAPAHVLGLLNVRGSLLTVIDLGRWLAELDAPAPRLPALGDERNAEGAEDGGSRRTPRLHSVDSAPSAASSAFLHPATVAGGRGPIGESRPAGHVLVVETEGRLGGCRVEGLGRAVAMPALDEAPGGNEGVGEIVLGVGEVDGELVAVLDLPRLVRHSLLFPGER